MLLTEQQEATVIAQMEKIEALTDPTQSRVIDNIQTFFHPLQSLVVISFRVTKGSTEVKEYYEFITVDASGNIGTLEKGHMSRADRMRYAETGTTLVLEKGGLIPER